MLPVSSARSGMNPVTGNHQELKVDHMTPQPSFVDDTVPSVGEMVSTVIMKGQVSKAAHLLVNIVSHLLSKLAEYQGSRTEVPPVQTSKRKSEEEQADESAIEPYQYRDPPQTKFPKHDSSNDSNFALIQMLRADNRRLSKENRSFAKASWETMRHQRENQALTGRIQSMESETIPSLLSRVKGLEGRKKDLKEENGILSQRLEMYKAKFGTLSEETSSQKEDRHELGGVSGSELNAKENEGENYWSDEEVAEGRTSGRRRDHIHEEKKRRERLLQSEEWQGEQAAQRLEMDRMRDHK